MTKIMMPPPAVRFCQLFDQERAYREHVEGSSLKAINGEVHHNVWREMIVQWCYNVVDHIQADREIVYVAINILDRFLASQASGQGPSHTQQYHTDKKDYEAAVMACLLITLKLQGISSLSISDLLKMSRSSVGSRDIMQAAEAIVQSLTWNKELPTAASFARALIDILPSSVDSDTRHALFEECTFSVELSVFDKDVSKELPSLVALTILEDAMVSQGIPQDIIRSFHANVSTITGLKYSKTLHHLFNNLRERGMGENDLDIREQQPTTIRGPTVIPPDDEDEGSPTIQHPSDFTLNLRPIFATNVVSMDNINEQVKQQHRNNQEGLLGKRQCTQKQSPMSRSKRYRAF